MKIAVVDDAIDVCRKHLAASSSANTQIGSFLTQYLLVLIGSKYEETILNLVRRRAEGVGDAHVSRFVAGTSRRVFRSMKVSELKGLLAYFGEDYKAAFTKMVENGKAQVAYDAILGARHGTAHGSSVSMTFEDVCRQYQQGVAVLDAFGQALGTDSNTP